MKSLEPIYTETVECQDCYKCLRQCAAKAIKIEQGRARVVPELCVLCGKCVLVCPVGAKRVRNDLELAAAALGKLERVVVSIAPSFVSEFDGIPYRNIISAFKALGFFGVSETALGAQEVSANTAMRLTAMDSGALVSSACPVVVELIRKHYPEAAGSLANMLSPLLTHSKLLRSAYGYDCGIVFAGPCIAKKIEADNSDLLAAALTFEEVRHWWQAAGIDPMKMEVGEDDDWLMGSSLEGALYPIDGGMIEGVKSGCGVSDSRLMAFSGMDALRDIMSGLGELGQDASVFLELLACQGGCVNGPCSLRHGGTVMKRQQIIANTQGAPLRAPRNAQIDIVCDWRIGVVARPVYALEQIEDALARVGKFRLEDELNCSGCGYETCRAFAEGLLDGRAEPSMCLGYMRQLAHKKADALIRTIPCGAVIVNDRLEVVECNSHFADLCGDSVRDIYQVKPGLEKAKLEKLIPYSGLFQQIIDSGAEKIEKDLRVEDLYLHVTVFTIEPHRYAGAIVQDITEPAFQKERIITKSRELMRRNVDTVQKIAYLLGESAAESELILNSIAESFSVQEDSDAD